MDFCSILTLARVDVGNIVKRVKIWKVLLLEVFLLVGFLTELCLQMSPAYLVFNTVESVKLPIIQKLEYVHSIF